MILKFIETIGTLISSVIGVVINTFEMILMLITTIPKAVAYIIGAVGYLPAFVGSIVIVSIGVSIAITLLNHWGN